MFLLSASATAFFVVAIKEQGDILTQLKTSIAISEKDGEIADSADFITIYSEAGNVANLNLAIRKTAALLHDFVAIHPPAKSLADSAIGELEKISAFPADSKGFAVHTGNFKHHLKMLHSITLAEADKAATMQRKVGDRYGFGYFAFVFLLTAVAFREVFRSRNAVRAMETTVTAIEQEAKDLHSQMISQKTIDPTTDLSNRLSLLMCDKKIHVALLDIKYFSKISGSYERKISDDILLDFFVRITQIISDPAYRVYRYDIDIAAITAEEDKVSTAEFIETCKKIHEKIWFYIYETNHISPNQVPVKVVIGIAGADSKIPITAAESALAQAKNSAGGFRVYKEQDHLYRGARDYQGHASQALVFCKANAEDRLIPYYQPILDAKTLMPVKYEALARVIDVNGDILPPNHFLGGVYYFGLNPAMTESLFLKVWEHARTIPVSFNVTISDIETPSLCSLIFGNMARDPQRSSRFTFEIVESEEESEGKKIASFILAVKQLGGKIAVDDFGSGYSNFNRLIADWKVDVIKIDGSIIREIKTDKKAKGVVLGIVQIARNANIKTVAEYVTDKEVLAIVRECGVDYVQGFHVGKPSPFESTIQIYAQIMQREG